MVAAIYHPPHLVLITALITGYTTFTHRLKKKKNTEKLPRVFTTAEQENQAWNLGVHIFLSPWPSTLSHLFILAVRGSERANLVCVAVRV